jgi:hypothetical protein
MRPRRMRRLVFAAVLIACGLPLAPAAAQSDLSDADIERRTRFIEERLDASRRHAQIWYWSWLTVNAGSAVGLGITAGFPNDTADVVNYVSQAGLALVGVADLTWIRPLQARKGAAPIRQLPDVTHEQRLEKLAQAEALLHANARRAASRKRWPIHVANFLINALAGGMTWAAGDPQSAAIATGSGFAVGELYIWTEPGRPEQDLKDYERFVSQQAASGARGGTGWSVVPRAGGLAISYRF